MPPRLDLTPEQALERIREQTRRRVAKHRAEQQPGNATRNATVGNVTALSSTQARTPRSPELSPTETERTTPPHDDVERIRLTLAPFAPRGYVHDPAFWGLMAERFPWVDLVVQAYGIARWLTGAKGKARTCNEAFLRNWITGEAAKRSPGAPAGGAPLREKRKPVGTQILELYGYAGD